MSGFVLVSALVLAVVATGHAQQPPPPAVARLPEVPASSKDGWWIRVDATATKATRIDWQFGTTTGNFNANASWQRSGHVEISVTPALRSGKVIQIKATTTPADASASFCVFFHQQSVAVFRFSGTENRQLNIDQRESQCAAPVIYRHERRNDVTPEQNPRLE
jgi:hypothetical protein